ncbi:hypothetical protein IJ768_00625 [Candidatus Saccharibacteria bacterium]|nr:hypothetical protein [Candidatus Saccharibacteria bacterium]
MEDNVVHDLYDDEIREDFVEDEGDEDNLGVPIKDGAEDYDDRSMDDDDLANLGIDPAALDDTEYNDNSFDCD